MEVLESIIEKFQDKQVLVIGDLFLDEHLHGDMLNISNEGPIPVVTVKEKSYFPYGAGFTAFALKSLGVTAHLVGFVGHDTNGKLVIDTLVKRKINIDGVFIHEKMKTNTKLRISAGGKHTPSQEILRVDTLHSDGLQGNWQQELLRVILKKIDEVDAVLLVDKLGAILHPDFIQKLVEIAHHANKPIIADSEKLNSQFKNFDLIVANDNEAAAATQINISDSETLKAAGTKILTKQQNKSVVITRGAEGMIVFETDGRITDIPTEALTVFNVRGAGDITAAALTAALAGGADIVQAATLANYAAGKAVSQSGISVVDKNDLVHFIRKQKQVLDVEKQVELDALVKIVVNARQGGKKVVWTNGCFDIMHVGHILYLEKAKALGDLLVVGLNSDASIREFKGPDRPIVEESQRAKLLSSLSCVDYITVFSDQTPMKLLDALKPDVYVKGGDYTIDTINQDERRLVEGYGGKIELMPGIKGMSTTALINKILKTYK